MNIYSAYLSDTELALICSEESFIKRMLAFEVALAQSQANLGIIPAAAANEISAKLQGLKIEPADLTEGTLRNGVPVLPFLTICRKELSGSTADYLHFGTTSQDVIDTAQVLMIKEAIAVLESRIEVLINNLTKLKEEFGNTPCMTRTRGQLAKPTTFEMKVRAWLDPMQRQGLRLSELKQRLLAIQLGGPVGVLNHFGDKAEGLVNELAKELGLSPSGQWHAQRDHLCEFTGQLAIVTGILGKMGADLLVLAQNEVNEIVESKDGGGKSTAMPHKENPILSEAMVAISRLNSNLQALMLSTLVHVGERDGSSWIAEWQTIPQMIMNTGTTLKHAITITEKMEVNTGQMKRNVEDFLSSKSAK